MIRHLAKPLALLLLALPSAKADAPFTVLGFHADMTLSDALQRAAALGGECRQEMLRTKLSGILAECAYARCAKAELADCEDKSGPASDAGRIAIADQPIVLITLEAASESARLRRVMFSYDGDTAVIAESFLDTFGPAAVDRMSAEEKSWSRSRRMSWESGAYRMGLVYRPDVVTLTVDPALREQAEISVQR